MSWPVLGRQATELADGFRAWRAVGLPVTTPVRPSGRGGRDRAMTGMNKGEAMTEIDITELHAQALDATGRIVAGIPADRWHADTPCEGWDVRALLNHVVSGNLWAAELGAGATIEGVGDRLDGDVLGADPAGSYATSAKAAAEVFRRPGALDAPCAVSYGPVPGRCTPGTGSSTCSSTAGTWRPPPDRTPRWTRTSCRPAGKSSSRR